MPTLAVATERWSDRKKTRTIDGNWTAYRGFDVIQYTTDDDALNAVGIPKVGDSHPDTTYLTCTRVWLNENKFSKGIVLAEYQITPLLANDVNPLNRQPYIKWRRGKTSQNVDLDYNGNPILNSATDAFKGKMSRPFGVRYLTITKFEPYYNQAEADLYIESVNSDAITFEGITFQPGQVYCDSIVPPDAYQKGSVFVKVQYDFEIRTPNWPNLTDLQIRHPFQRRVLDQGTRAIYHDDGDDTDKLGKLYLPDGSEVTHDVLLDGNGRPLDSTIKVTAGMLDPVKQTPPKGVLVDSTEFAVFLIYMDYPETAFANLQ